MGDVLQTSVAHLTASPYDQKIVERSARIGLASKRWERLVLPLNYDREMEQ